MNKLFMYLVGIGVLILILIIGWEVLQILSGLSSSFNQAVIEMPRNSVFTENLKSFLNEKYLIRSGLN